MGMKRRWMEWERFWKKQDFWKRLIDSWIIDLNVGMQNSCAGAD